MNRGFFISSGLATGYNRFDLPIRQAESSVEKAEIQSLTLSYVCRVTSSLRLGTTLYGNGKATINLLE